MRSTEWIKRHTASNFLKICTMYISPVWKIQIIVKNYWLSVKNMSIRCEKLKNCLQLHDPLEALAKTSSLAFDPAICHLHEKLKCAFLHSFHLQRVFCFFWNICPSVLEESGMSCGNKSRPSLGLDLCIWRSDGKGSKVDWK